MYYLAREFKGEYLEIINFKYESKELASLDIFSLNMLKELEKKIGEWKVVKIKEA